MEKVIFRECSHDHFVYTGDKIVLEILLITIFC
jgi:hypothetical protein